MGVAYNIGSLGGAIAPILGTALAIQVGLGWALAILMFSWTLVVIAIVGFNIPGRILRRTVGVDSFNAEPIEPEKHIEPSDVTETKPVNLV